MTKDVSWRIKEKVVAALEKAILPDSRVEHDVRLPIVAYSSKGKRQCDIVIGTGDPTNEIITIVEVQNRKSKTDINTFSGWVEKMRDLGASHLFCVSGKGFSKTIVEKAKSLGPAIRLLTLSDIEKGLWPVDIINGHHEVVFYRLDQSMGQFIFGWVNEIPKLTTVDPNVTSILIEGQKSKYSLSDLFAPVVSKARKFLTPPPKTDYLSLKVSGNKYTWLHQQKGFDFTWVQCNSLVYSSAEHFPISMSEYVKVIEGERLGWVLKNSSKDGKEMHCPIIYNEKNNHYTIGAPVVEGFRPNQKVIVSIEPTRN